MVSIGDNNSYLANLKTNTQIDWFVNYIIAGHDNQCPKVNYGDATTVAKNLLVAIKHTDVEASKKIMAEFSKRKISKESYWIWNEFVVFSLVATVKKFKLENAWTREVINLMGSSPNKEVSIMAKTFQNILAGNINSKEDYYQVSIVYQFILDEVKFDDERLSKMFKHLWNNPFPFFESDFLNIVSLKAIEIAFNAKGLLDPQQFYDTNKFVKTFAKRTLLLGKIGSWVVVTMLVTVIAYTINSIGVDEFPNTKVGKWIGVISGVGFALVSIISGLRKKAEIFLIKNLRLVLGYRIN